MAATGRPTKLDDLTAKRILDAIKAGSSRAGVAGRKRQRMLAQAAGSESRTAGLVTGDGPFDAAWSVDGASIR
jgi:hypothetical protein